MKNNIFCAVCQCTHMRKAFKNGTTISNTNLTPFQQYFQIQFQIGEKICRKKMDEYREFCKNKPKNFESQILNVNVSIIYIYIFLYMITYSHL